MTTLHLHSGQHKRADHDTLAAALNAAVPAPFDANNLTGRRKRPGATVSLGWLEGLPSETAHRLHDAVTSADYVIRSYETPIAWHTPDGWTLLSEVPSPHTGKTTPTTRRHIAHILRALDYCLEVAPR